MHDAIREMLSAYKCTTPSEYKNALKEIVQEIALLGLSRQGFFDHAAFYGGTSLRIAHGLNRFSEDLDFTLLKTNNEFNFKSYLKGIEEELLLYNLKTKVDYKDKNNNSTIESAFLKTNTIEMLLTIKGWEQKKIPLNKNDVISIKLEIDADPPIPAGEVEVVFLSLPIPFSYKKLTLPSLFSGKLHAVLCRKFKSGRVKGRDFYDFAWFIYKGVQPDMPYLQAKLIQSGHWKENENLGISQLKKLLKSRFETIDWESAKTDVSPFIKDSFALEVWSKDYFISLLGKISS